MLAILGVAAALAVEPAVITDYTKMPSWTADDLACKHAKAGLRCRSTASDRRHAWVVFGPPAQSASGSYAVSAALYMKWGGSSGVAFGRTDGSWSGVLVRQDTEVWAGSYAADTQTWTDGLPWFPLVMSGPGFHIIDVVVDGQQVTVTVDGLPRGTYTSAVPLSGEVAPIVFDDADVTFVSVAVQPR